MKYTKILLLVALVGTSIVQAKQEDKVDKKGFITLVEGYLAKNNETFQTVHKKGGKLFFGVNNKPLSIQAWDEAALGFPAPTLETLPTLEDAKAHIAAYIEAQKPPPPSVNEAQKPPPPSVSEALKLAENKVALFLVNEGLSTATNGNSIAVGDIVGLFDTWDGLSSNQGNEKYAKYVRLLLKVELLGGASKALSFHSDVVNP